MQLESAESRKSGFFEKLNVVGASKVRERGIVVDVEDKFATNCVIHYERRTKEGNGYGAKSITFRL